MTTFGCLNAIKVQSNQHLVHGRAADSARRATGKPYVPLLMTQYKRLSGAICQPGAITSGLPAPEKRGLILFAQGLGECFAVGIEEVLAALLPGRFHFRRADVPVGSAFPGNGA